MYKTRCNCISATVLVLAENELIYKFIQGLNVFILNRNISEFLWKNPCKKKKVRKNCFDEQEKSWTYLKMFRKKHKNLKTIWAVLGHSKPKIFKTLAVADIFSRPWPPNYFNAATALTLQLTIYIKYCEAWFVKTFWSYGLFS